MKASRNDSFRPITFTVETQDEFNLIKDFVDECDDTAYVALIYDFARALKQALADAKIK